MINYNKEIRQVKRSSWKRYCQEIDNVLRRERLMRIIKSYMVVSTHRLEGKL